MSYFNWYPGQPEGPNDKCIVMKDVSHGNKWADRQCLLTITPSRNIHNCSFVCEY